MEKRLNSEKLKVASDKSNKKNFYYNALMVNMVFKDGQ
jgi:hypothetical protein